MQSSDGSGFGFGGISALGGLYNEEEGIAKGGKGGSWN